MRSYEEVKLDNMEGALIRSYSFEERCSVVDGNVANFGVLWWILLGIRWGVMWWWVMLLIRAAYGKV